MELAFDKDLEGAQDVEVQAQIETNSSYQTDAHWEGFFNEVPQRSLKKCY